MNLLESQIDRELKKLDPNLYLDKHFFEGRIFWSVRYAHKAGEEPLFVVTSPELSWDMVSRVRLNEGDIRDAINQVKLRNLALREERKEKMLEALEEAAAEHDRSTGKLRRWYIRGVKPI